MPDMSKAEVLIVTGFCPQQDKEYAIRVHIVPDNGVWKRFGLTCDHMIKDKVHCLHQPCPLLNLPITKKSP